MFFQASGLRLRHRSIKTVELARSRRLSLRFYGGGLGRAFSMHDLRDAIYSLITDDPGRATSRQIATPALFAVPASTRSQPRLSTMRMFHFRPRPRASFRDSHACRSRRRFFAIRALLAFFSGADRLASHRV